MANVVAAAGLGLPVLVALLLGPMAFAVAVVLVAALVLFDVSGLLARSQARPVVLVAAVPALGLPIAAAADPVSGWERLPLYFAGTVLAAFALVLVFGRRRRVVAGLGATAFVALLVGLGAASLLLLRGLDLGFRWVLGFGLLAAAADLGASIADLVRARVVEEHEPDEDLSPSRWDLPATVLLVTVVAAALAALLEPPFRPGTAAVFALVAVTAGLGGTHLRRSLAAEAGAPVGVADALRVGEGLFLGVVDVVLLGAPAVYVLARAEAL
jgi:hypothetical protein